MNGISFTPQVNYNVNVAPKNRPSFTARPNAKQVKDAGCILKGLYSTFFVPCKESVVRMAEGSVYTERMVSNGAKRIGKKYPMWSRVPSEVIEENRVTSILTRKKFNPDGTFDLTIRDRHVPEYNISVGYERVADTRSKYAHDFQQGNLKLQYCDKKLELSAEQRTDMLKDIRTTLSEKYDDTINGMLKKSNYANFKEFSEGFYKDPDVIAQCILNSPHSLQDQLKRVSTSMPYGIERIFERMGK